MKEELTREVLEEMAGCEGGIAEIGGSGGDGSKRKTDGGGCDGSKIKGRGR